MSRDPRVSVLMGAFALALRARLGALVTVEEVDALRAEAEAQLPEGDGLRFDVLAFATQHQAHRQDRAAMVEIGAALERAVHRATRPDAVDAGRVDIHG